MGDDVEFMQARKILEIRLEKRQLRRSCHSTPVLSEPACDSSCRRAAGTNRDPLSEDTAPCETPRPRCRFFAAPLEELAGANRALRLPTCQSFLDLDHTLRPSRQSQALVIASLRTFRLILGWCSLPSSFVDEGLTCRVCTGRSRYRTATTTRAPPPAGGAGVDLHGMQPRRDRRGTCPAVRSRPRHPRHGHVPQRLTRAQPNSPASDRPCSPSAE